MGKSKLENDLNNQLAMSQAEAKKAKSEAEAGDQQALIPTLDLQGGCCQLF